MGIQGSINNLLSQVQRLATFYVGKDKVDQITGDTTATKNESQIQTEIAAGNAPMKDGKVDSEWLQKRREEHKITKMGEFYKYAFNGDGTLTKDIGEARARFLEKRVKRGLELYKEDKEFYNNAEVQKYLKSFNEKNAKFESALNTLESSISPELKNKVAEKLARGSVEARTNSINKAKSNFDEHTASLIRYYGKGSGNP